MVDYRSVTSIGTRSLAIVIDTPALASHMIKCVVSDSAGLTGTSTRTVTVSAPARRATVREPQRASQIEDDKTVDARGRRDHRSELPPSPLARDCGRLGLHRARPDHSPSPITHARPALESPRGHLYSAEQGDISILG
jgi:hypothetical protein